MTGHVSKTEKIYKILCIAQASLAWISGFAFALPISILLFDIANNLGLDGWSSFLDSLGIYDAIAILTESFLILLPGVSLFILYHFLIFRNPCSAQKYIWVASFIYNALLLGYIIFIHYNHIDIFNEYNNRKISDIIVVFCTILSMPIGALSFMSICQICDTKR